MTPVPRSRRPYCSNSLEELEHQLELDTTKKNDFAHACAEGSSHHRSSTVAIVGGREFSSPTTVLTASRPPTNVATRYIVSALSIAPSSIRKLVTTPVASSDNEARTQNGHIRNETGDVSRRISTACNSGICRRNRVADDRACTCVTRRNFHGKEGVDGSSRSEGSAKAAERKSRVCQSAELARPPVCGGYGAVYGALSSEAASGKRQKLASQDRAPSPVRGRADIFGGRQRLAERATSS